MCFRHHCFIALQDPGSPDCQRVISGTVYLSSASGGESGVICSGYLASKGSLAILTSH